MKWNTVASLKASPSVAAGGVNAPAVSGGATVRVSAVAELCSVRTWALPPTLTLSVAAPLPNANVPPLRPPEAVIRL